MQIAITREVSTSINECELTFLDREPIDVGRARKQHARYEHALKAAGLAVLSLPEEPGMPDAVFVEDTALVLDECAVITRPGAPSRRGEAESVARALSFFRDVLWIEPPGSLDGGDILRLGRTIYVGVGTRSDAAAITQMQALLRPMGYVVRPVEVAGCLHLKSAACEVAPGLVLANPDWITPDSFGNVRILTVDPSEPRGANALWLGQVVLCAEAFPRTVRRLENAGLRTGIVEADELAKAEGGLTCCSLIVSV